MFFSNKRHEEVPESRSLAPDVNIIIKEVCKFYDVKNHELLTSRRGHFNEPRNVAIYLIRNLRGETLKGVGEVFGINRNSTVSSVVERLNREIRRNKKIKKRVEDLKATLIKSQE
jgi:putative transposase